MYLMHNYKNKHIIYVHNIVTREFRFKAIFYINLELISCFINSMLFLRSGMYMDGMEVVTLRDYTPRAYSLFFKLMYGLDVLEGCDDSNVLFQIYGLAEKYLGMASL